MQDRKRGGERMMGLEKMGRERGQGIRRRKKRGGWKGTNWLSFLAKVHCAMILFLIQLHIVLQSHACSRCSLLFPLSRGFPSRWVGHSLIRSRLVAILAAIQELRANSEFTSSLAASFESRERSRRIMSSRFDRSRIRSKAKEKPGICAKCWRERRNSQDKAGKFRQTEIEIHKVSLFFLYTVILR